MARYATLVVQITAGRLIQGRTVYGPPLHTYATIHRTACAIWTSGRNYEDVEKAPRQEAFVASVYTFRYFESARMLRVAATARSVPCQQVATITRLWLEHLA